MPFQITSPIGPVLFLDDVENGQLRLSALFVTAARHEPPPIELATGTARVVRLADYDHATVWRARFSLPADRSSTYAWDNESYEVAGDLTRDLRLAYVSCNGEEVGDMEREGSERNAMWARLRDEHRRRPFALMLHGDDQVYADEVTQGHELSDDWPERLPRDPSREALADLRHHLRERFFARYAALYEAPELAWLAALGSENERHDRPARPLTADFTAAPGSCPEKRRDGCRSQPTASRLTKLLISMQYLKKIASEYCIKLNASQGIPVGTQVSPCAPRTDPSMRS